MLAVATRRLVPALRERRVMVGHILNVIAASRVRKMFAKITERILLTSRRRNAIEIKTLLA